MPAPYWFARANRYLLNPLARRLAGTMPPFILIKHRGRVSGKHRQAPVFGFFEDSTASIVVALTYGPEVDWLKNLQAARGGEVTARGRTYQVGTPTVHADLGQTAAIPTVIRPILRMLRVSQVARLPRRRDGPEQRLRPGSS